MVFVIFRTQSSTTRLTTGRICKRRIVGAIPCGCPMNNLLTKENKTGWKEVYFLTEALSPSPTPLKKKGGSRREDSEKNDLIDHFARNKCKTTLSTCIPSTCQLNQTGTGKIRCKTPRLYDGSRN